MSTGSGDGVRERARRLDRLGKSDLEGKLSFELECDSEAFPEAVAVGAAARLIINADSASNVSPIL